MPPFALEAAVRLKFRLEDVSEASSELIEASILHGHNDILARVREDIVAAPPESVVIAETLLAGAALLRSLAARQALEKRDLRLSGHQFTTGQRFPALLETASAAELEAGRLLTPFLKCGVGLTPPVLLTAGE